MPTNTNTTTTIDNDVVANAIAHAVVRPRPDLNHEVRALILAEQADALASVLRRLNSDTDGWHLRMVKREPATLLTMLIEEHTKRLEEMLLLRNEEQINNNANYY